MVGAVLCAAVLGAPPARADWTAPVRLSSAGTNAPDGFVAMNDAGVTVAAWSENDGSKAGPHGYIHRPGGPDCDEIGDTLTAITGVWPVVTPQGDVVIAGGTNDGMNAAVIPAGACSGQTVTLERADGTGAGDLDIKVDPAGGVTVFWTRHEQIHAAYRPPGGSFATPTVVSNPDDILWNPQYAVGGDGDAMVSWSYGHNLYVAMRRHGGAFTTQRFATAYRNAGIRQAMDARGNGVLAWVEMPDDGTGDLKIADWPAGGDLQSPVLLRHGSIPGIEVPVFAVARDGEMTMTLNGTDGSAVMVARTRAPGGVWGPEEPVTRTVWYSAPPRLAYDRSGNLFAVWQCACDAAGAWTEDYHVYAAERAAGGRFSGATTPLQDPRGATGVYSLAAGPPGEATAILVSGSHPGPTEVDRVNHVGTATSPAATRPGQDAGTSSAGGGGPAPQAGSDSSAPRARRCVVPHLRHHSLAAARRLLRAHRCALGRVRAIRRRAHRHRVVIRQDRRPLTSLPVNARIGVSVR